MTKKLLAILLVILVVASICACTPQNNEEETTTSSININDETNTGSEVQTDENGSEIGTGSNVENDAPEEFSFVEKTDTVYVLHENGAVNLHNEDNSNYKSVANGTALNRVAISNDANGTWSKVIYEDKSLYIYTICVTTLADLDEGFTEVSKTLHKSEGSLNIRIAPSMANRVIGHLEEGDEVKVVMENATTGWYKIEFTNYAGEKTYGYVASDAKYYVESATEAPTEAPTESATEAATEESEK